MSFNACTEAGSTRLAAAAAGAALGGGGGVWARAAGDASAIASAKALRAPNIGLRSIMVLSRLTNSVDFRESTVRRLSSHRSLTFRSTWRALDPPLSPERQRFR